MTVFDLGGGATMSAGATTPNPISVDDLLATVLSPWERKYINYRNDPENTNKDPQLEVVYVFYFSVT